MYFKAENGYAAWQFNIDIMIIQRLINFKTLQWFRVSIGGLVYFKKYFLIKKALTNNFFNAIIQSI